MTLVLPLSFVFLNKKIINNDAKLTARDFLNCFLYHVLNGWIFFLLVGFIIVFWKSVKHEALKITFKLQ